jgi:hypothetical protein
LYLNIWEWLKTLYIYIFPQNGCLDTKLTILCGSVGILFFEPTWPFIILTPNVAPWNLQFLLRELHPLAMY